MKYFNKTASKFDILKFLQKEKLMGKVDLHEAEQLGSAFEELRRLHQLGKVPPELLQQLGKSQKVALASVKTANKNQTREEDWNTKKTTYNEGDVSAEKLEILKQIGNQITVDDGTRDYILKNPESSTVVADSTFSPYGNLEGVTHSVHAGLPLIGGLFPSKSYSAHRSHNHGIINRKFDDVRVDHDPNLPETGLFPSDGLDKKELIKLQSFNKTAKKKKKEDNRYLRDLGVGTLGAVIGGVLLQRYGAKNALAVNMPKMEIPKSKWAKYFEKMRQKMNRGKAAVGTAIGKVTSKLPNTSDFAARTSLGVAKIAEDESWMKRHPILTAAGVAGGGALGIALAKSMQRTQKVNAVMRDIKNMGYKLTKEEEAAARALANDLAKFGDDYIIDFNKLKGMI